MHRGHTKVLVQVEVLVDPCYYHVSWALTNPTFDSLHLDSNEPVLVRTLSAELDEMPILHAVSWRCIRHLDLAVLCWGELIPSRSVEDKEKIVGQNEAI